jgi:hypothetical protein
MMAKVDVGWEREVDHDRKEQSTIDDAKANRLSSFKRLEILNQF